MRYTNAVLKSKLEYHYKQFDIKTLSPDPAEYLLKRSKPEDIECAGLISSVMAYGNVKQINNSLRAVFGIIGDDPADFLRSFEINDWIKEDKPKHRFYTPQDIYSFFHILKSVLSDHGTLKNFFISNYNADDLTVKEMLERSGEKLSAYAENTPKGLTRGIKFMFPKPSGGSACKRMNLFLRWMVRKDSIDYGLWKEIPPSKLIIPVDTHIAKIARKLRLTKMKNVSWKMAEEITGNLKKFDPDDPVKYDFALCHIGIRKLEF